MPDTLRKKSLLMVYVGTYDCYENIKIKLWSTISILKPWHIFCYKNDDCKVGNIISREGSVASVHRAVGGLSPSARDLGGRDPKKSLKTLKSL